MDEVNLRCTRVMIEYYPVLTLDTRDNLDLEHQYAQLQADVDRLPTR